MRNLKKLLAVIVSVCVLATFALPAFAAETTTLTDAQISEKLGAVKGDTSQGVTDEYLAKGTTRLQAAIIYLRMLNLEEEALAFESEDNFADAADVPWAGGRAILAYLKANPELGWQGVSETTFEPNGAASAQMMYKVALEALGYKQGTDFEWADVFTFAEDKGLGKAADLAELTNNDMCTIVVEMLGIEVKAGDKTLIEKLVEDGIVDEADAIEVGLIAATPDELEIESVTATNLIQAVVTFNQKVDSDTANDEENYDFATADKIEIDNAALADDGVSVVLTFKEEVDQQKTAKLTVSNVKSAEGVAMAKTTVEVSFLDNTIPEILSAEVVGVSSIKVTFSEPMNDTTVKNSSFSVNDGKYYVKSVTGQKNNTEFIVELYTSLKDGDLPFEVKVGPADYAGFTAMGLKTTLTVVEDKDAPVVVSYKDAKPTSVTLIWSEDIQKGISTDEGDYYHTNGKNEVKDLPEVEGNEMKLTFDKEHKLPNGTAYVYVAKDAVKDYWNNKNAQQMVKIDVVVDNDPPVLESIEVKEEDQIVLAFNEDVDDTSARKRVNYTFLDKDGKEVKNVFKNATVNGKKVTVNFNKDLEGGDYTLVVEDIEDMEGNAMSSTSMAFTITDLTEPNPDKFAARVYTVSGPDGKDDQILKVSFGEAMAIDGAYRIDDLAKYVIVDGAVTTRIEKLDDVSIAVVDDGKAVEITIPYSAKFSVPLSTGDDPETIYLRVARVADAADNYTVDLINAVKITGQGDITIEKAELTGEKEVKVYFSDELVKFEAEEVIFTVGGKVSKIAKVSTELDDGKTVATYTLDDAVKYDASDLTITTVNKDAEGKDIEIVTANRYDETLQRNLELTLVNEKLEDKLAPALDVYGKDEDDDVIVAHAKVDGKFESTITLTFTEILDVDYLSFGSFEVSGFKVKSADTDTGADSKVVKIVVEDDDLYVEVDTAISLKTPIRDLAGNELDELETSVMRLFKSADASIEGVEVDGVAATVDGVDETVYNVELPEGTVLADLVAGDVVVTKTDANATVGTATTSDDGKTWTVIVTAEDGSTKVTYTINVTVALSEAKAITATIVGTLDGGNIIDVPAETKVSDFKAGLTVSDDATVEILDGAGGSAVADQATTDVTADMVIEVTAENGTKAEYTITMAVVLSDEKAITATTIGTLDNGNIINVPAETKVSDFKAGLTVSDDATVEILDGAGGSAVTDQATTDVTATMVIKVTAEDSSTAEYTITMAL